MARSNLTKRKLQSLESRKRIFQTAIGLIKKKGFDRVTIEEICSAANVSKGLFYNYFSSKDQIVVEQFLDVDNYYKGAVEKHLRDFKGIEKLLKFVVFQMKYIRHALGKHLIRNVYRSLIMSGKTGHIMLDEGRYLYTFLRETVEEAKNMGELPLNVDTREICTKIVVIMRGAIYSWCLYDRDFNLEDTAVEMISAFMKGIQSRRKESMVTQIR